MLTILAFALGIPHDSPEKHLQRYGSAIMRITGGTHRGRILETPKGADIRPTTDKIRQAIFNILASRSLLEANSTPVVLDTFCGTGAMGIESLSRGAAFCIFFDKARDSLSLCRRNLATLGLSGRAVCLERDSTHFAPRPGSVPAAQLVFLDPPYGQGLIAPALDGLFAGNWLAGGACHALIEISRAEPVPILPRGSSCLLEKTYGNTRVLLVSLSGQSSDFQ